MPVTNNFVTLCDCGCGHELPNEQIRLVVYGRTINDNLHFESLSHLLDWESAPDEKNTSSL